MTAISTPAFPVVQNNQKMLVFLASAKTVYDYFDVSRRVDDKELGYQRSFSKSRIKQIKNYLNQEKGIIPNSVLVNLDSNKYSFSEEKHELTLYESETVGLIIDGQHRVKGSYEANPDFLLMVVATLELSYQQQAKLFVKINQTQKGVPASLYLDLLPLLQGKEIEDFDQEGVSAEDRAREIAVRLNETESSPFFELIRRTGESGLGISLSEFVRQAKDYVEPNTGKLAKYGFEEQYKIFEIYFRAVKSVFLEQWEDKKSYILKTVGFGGLMIALHDVLNIVLQQYHKFDTNNTIKVLQKINDFKFDRDNLPSGAGFNAQKKVGKMIVSQLNNKIRESQAFVNMIGD